MRPFLVMYEEFFGLTEAPFNQTPDPQFFFSSLQHLDAFSLIEQGILRRKGFVVITGEVGTGKTTLCRYFLETVDPNVKTALILNPGLTTIELLQAINHAFGIPSQSFSKKELIDQLNWFLLDTLKAGGNAALLIDEAQHLSVECLEEIRLLSNLETAKEKLLQIVLLGQPELGDKLRLAELRQLAQRVASWYQLVPLDSEETRQYIAMRLGIAGGDGKVGFTPEAARRVYTLSKGIPRLINDLCEKALHAAAITKNTVIGEALVDEVGRELGGVSKRLPQPRPLTTTPEQRRPRVRVTPSWVVLAVLVVIGVLGALYWLSLTWMKVNESLHGAKKSSSPQDAPAIKIPKTLFPTPDASKPVPDLKVQATHIAPALSAAKLKEARLMATLSLLRMWGFLPSTPPKKIADQDPTRLIRESGLQSARLPVDLGLLGRLDYPCLLEWKDAPSGVPHTVALVGLNATEATIFDHPVGRRAVSRADLLQHVEGEARIFWKALPGIKVPLRAGKGKDPVITALQKFLRAQRLLAGPVTGVYDPATRAAVARLQEEYGLKATGVFGVRSYIALSKRVSGAQGPSLRAKSGTAGLENP
jgi:general secretion pathway protein A